MCFWPPDCGRAGFRGSSFPAHGTLLQQPQGCWTLLYQRSFPLTPSVPGGIADPCGGKAAVQAWERERGSPRASSFHLLTQSGACWSCGPSGWPVSSRSPLVQRAHDRGQVSSRMSPRSLQWPSSNQPAEPCSREKPLAGSAGAVWPGTGL